MIKTKPKRARTKKGRFKADDKSTIHINEAYEKPNDFKDYVIAFLILAFLFSLFI